jgi:monoterpene epsilon-lactone hydrolase
MATWRSEIQARLKRRFHPGVDQNTSIVELRRRYSGIVTRFVPAPADMAVEPAQIGQIRGEWIRVREAQPQRLILYLHGGGFIAGSCEAYRPLIAHLCKHAGAAALSIDYRLGPEFPFPAGLRDAVDAYRFLTAKGISPGSIALAGNGAGGGLAFAAAMAIRNAGLKMPAAVLAMSPWADLTLSGWSMMTNARRDGMLDWDLLFVSARHYLKSASPADPYASPVFGNLRDFPPIMVHAGSLEILRDDASRLGELAAAAHIPVSIEVYDGMGHLFQATSAKEAGVSLGRLGQFIRSRTEQPARGAEMEMQAHRN